MKIMTCRKCGEVISEELGNWAPSAVERRRRECRTCNAVRARGTNITHRAANAEKMREWREEHPDRVAELAKRYNELAKLRSISEDGPELRKQAERVLRKMKAKSLAERDHLLDRFIIYLLEQRSSVSPITERRKKGDPAK